MLSSKLALVTGSTSGIGLGIARRLANQGCNLVLNGFGDQKEIDGLCKELADKHKIKVYYEGANMAKVSDIEAMMGNIAKINNGRSVDILVNNAGIQHVSPVETFSTSRWDDVISINLSSVFHTTRLSVPSMKAQNYGRIVNIASAHGLVASAEKSAYVAAKHGVVGLTKVIALETAKTNVTCNAICPGWVLTPLVQKQVDEKQKIWNVSPVEAKARLLSEKQPSQEFVSPEQLGDLAVFLCSPGAQQVRGVAWAMDGGWTAQ